jgi:REP element-mobilizing transposase RayT
MVQRRVVHRRFYLKPTPRTTAIFLYCLAWVVRATRVQIHEFIVMSNHYHIVLTDPHGRLPKFTQQLHGLVARAVNASYGKFGTFWENEQYAAPELPDDADVVDKSVYALTNAQAADLVERAHQWPGLSSWKLEYGEAIVAHKPSTLFSRRMPKELRFKLVRPAVYLDLDDVQLRALIRRRVVEREEQLILERRRAGRTVLGVKRILAQNIEDMPASREKRWGIRPRVSSRSVWHRVALIRRNQGWLAEYREALARFVAGVRDVLFPYGTYLMKERYAVACATA